MSRRIRTKIKNRPIQMGLNHHSDYSSSSTYFPQSYSIFGTPISIPLRILPLHQNEKINFVCHAHQILDQNCAIYSLSELDWMNAKQVNITIQGNITQTSNSIVTKLLFALTMVFCLVSKIFSNGFFRRKFYTQYEIPQKIYLQLVKILSNLDSCRLLVINIQDNEMNNKKLNILKQFLHQLITKSKIKRKIIIRNYCYYMNEVNLHHQMSNFGEHQHCSITLIWENHVFKIEKNQNQQKVGLLYSALDC